MITRRLCVAMTPILVAALLGACGGDDDSTAESTAPVETSAPSATAPSSTSPSVEATDAPEPDATDVETTSAPTAAPTTTNAAPDVVIADAEDATELIQSLLGDPPPVVTTPAELAEHLADALASTGDPARVDEVSAGEPASAVLTVLATGDDSVVGIRYTVSMEGDDSYGWVVASATSEYLCARGADGPLCV